MLQTKQQDTARMLLAELETENKQNVNLNKALLFFVNNSKNSYSFYVGKSLKCVSTGTGN